MHFNEIFIDVFRALASLVSYSEEQKAKSG